MEALENSESSSLLLCASMVGWLFKIGLTVQNWLRYYFAFSKAGLFITGLVFGHGVVENAVVVAFMAYLMAEWKEDLQKSAATVNIIQGVTSVITLACAHVADTYIGHFEMLLFSTTAYIIGLSFLCLSALKNFPQTKACLFYVAVAMIAMGKAGRNSSLKPFLAYQFRAEQQDGDDVRSESRRKLWWRLAWLMGILVTSFEFPCLLWPQTFELTTYVMAAAFVVFLCGIPFYHCTTADETESPLTTVCRVFKVAMLHRRVDYPTHSYQFYERNQSFTLPQTSHFRWLDRAAIMKASSNNPVEEERRGRICTVTQVEETKLLLGMIPIWMTFLVYSLVKSTGENFFIEQATNMNWCDNSIFTLCLIKFFVSLAISSLYETIPAKERNANVVRIGLGMLTSLGCCIVAWGVEARRLSLDKSEANLSMKIAWFVPQFCCLGLMEGLAEGGINGFFCLQISRRMEVYGPVFTGFVVGVGNFASALCIYTSRRWFNVTLNNTRLDKYYQMLAMLSCINLCCYFYVSRLYTCNKPIEGQGPTENCCSK